MHRMVPALGAAKKASAEWLLTSRPNQPREIFELALRCGKRFGDGDVRVL